MVSLILSNTSSYMKKTIFLPWVLPCLFPIVSTCSRWLSSLVEHNTAYPAHNLFKTRSSSDEMPSTNEVGLLSWVGKPKWFLISTQAQQRTTMSRQCLWLPQPLLAFWGTGWLLVHPVLATSPQGSQSDLMFSQILLCWSISFLRDFIHILSSKYSSVGEWYLRCLYCACELWKKRKY